MKHPQESQLALYAGGDLSFLDRLRIRSHIGSCPVCSAAVAAYRKSREHLRAESSEVPQSLNWDRLAAEMTGNIRVGLAAGECVDERSRAPKVFPWKPALSAAGLAVVLMSGWWLNFPSEQRETLARGIERLWHRDLHQTDASVYLEANRAGIQFRENGSALTFMHPDVPPSVISVSTQGSMRARYVDSDTGQVTITNVYAQ